MVNDSYFAVLIHLKIIGVISVICERSIAVHGPGVQVKIFVQQIEVFRDIICDDRIHFFNFTG